MKAEAPSGEETVEKIAERKETAPEVKRNKPENYRAGTTLTVLFRDINKKKLTRNLV